MGTTMKETILKGTFGTIIPITAAASLNTVEMWMRLTSLGLGIVVGFLTIVGLIKRMPKK
jgi:hypothetical protein